MGTAVRANALRFADEAAAQAALARLRAQLPGSVSPLIPRGTTPTAVGLMLLGLPLGAVTGALGGGLVGGLTLLLSGAVSWVAMKVVEWPIFPEIVPLAAVAISAAGVIAASFAAAGLATLPVVALAELGGNGSRLVLGCFGGLASLAATATLAAVSWWWWELSIESAAGMLLAVAFGTIASIAAGIGWSAGRASVSDLRACPGCSRLMQGRGIGGTDVPGGHMLASAQAAGSLADPGLLARLSAAEAPVTLSLFTCSDCGHGALDARANFHGTWLVSGKERSCKAKWLFYSGAVDPAKVQELSRIP